MKTLNWTAGENDCQNYYDAYVGKDYLCVYALKKYPHNWYGMYIKDGSTITIMDKTFNERQRKKDQKNGITQGVNPSVIKFLSSKDPEYMMQKVEYAYQNGKQEICR